jgi:hypothetical protein
MLGVHPPHAAAHSWKDFFVHIATISVGLLIAIGLEQTAILERDLNQTQKAESELERDMVILRKHQVSQSPLQRNLITPGCSTDFPTRRGRPRLHSAPRSKWPAPSPRASQVAIYRPTIRNN